MKHSIITAGFPAGLKHFEDEYRLQDGRWAPLHEIKAGENDLVMNTSFYGPAELRRDVTGKRNSILIGIMPLTNRSNALVRYIMSDPTAFTRALNSMRPHLAYTKINIKGMTNDILGRLQGFGYNAEETFNQEEAQLILGKVFKWELIHLLLPNGAFHHFISDWREDEMKQLFSLLKKSGFEYKHLFKTHYIDKIQRFDYAFIRQTVNLLGNEVLKYTYKGETIIHPFFDQALLERAIPPQTFKTILYLLESGVDINSCSEFSGNVLHQSIAFENIKASLSLIDLIEKLSQSSVEFKHFDYLTQDFEGKTPLLIAAKISSSEIVTKLLSLKHNVGIDVPDHSGRTPLMYALAYGNVISTEALITAGADMTKKDNAGKDCAWYASAPREVVEELLKEIHIDPRRTSAQYDTVRSSWATYNGKLLFYKKPGSERDDIILINTQSRALIHSLIAGSTHTGLKQHLSFYLRQLSHPNSEKTILDLFMERQVETRQLFTLQLTHFKVKMIQLTFIKACATGDINTARLLLTQAPPLALTTDKHGRTPLHLVVLCQKLAAHQFKHDFGDIDEAKWIQNRLALTLLLINYGVDPDKQHSGGRSFRDILAAQSNLEPSSKYSELDIRTSKAIQDCFPSRDSTQSDDDVTPATVGAPGSSL